MYLHITRICIFISFSLSVALAVTLSVSLYLCYLYLVSRSVSIILRAFNKASQPQRECMCERVCVRVCVCMCACCMRRLVPCPSRPLTSSLLASICTYSSLEPVASGPQAALRHTRHARRQRRFARRDGEVAVLGQHIALPITSKTRPGIPPSIRRFPPVMVSFVSLTRSSSLSFVVHNSL